MRKITYIFMAIILLLAMVITFLIFRIGTPAENNDENCSSDFDCVIAAVLDSVNSCCETCKVKAINKQAKLERAEWYSENCGREVGCPMFDCYTEKLPKPRCANSQCVIEWINRPGL